MKQRLLILTHAGAITGFGHLVRCLNIADALDSLLWDVEVAAGKHASGLSVALSTNYRFSNFGALDKLAASDLPTSDWVLLDFFQHDAELETACRKTGRKVFVIDGMLRSHDADILFDPIERPKDMRLAKNQNAGMIIEGPKYAPISERFTHICPLNSDAPLQLGIALGSATHTRDTDSVLRSLERLDFCGAVTVVGKMSPETAVSFDVTQTDWIEDGPAFLSSCSAVIGACGMSAWERCAAGMPALSFLTVENQVYVAEVLETAKAGQVERISPHKMKEAHLDASVSRFLCRRSRWREFGENGKRTCDGLGSSRLAGALSAYPKNDVFA